MNRQTYQPTAQPSVMPPVIKNLLIINGLFFLAQYVAGATLGQSSVLANVLQYLALYPPGAGEYGATLFGGRGTVPGFWPWQVVSYAFLHADFWHIALNMFILWMFGMQVENRWGSQRFGLFYFFCVVGAALTHLLFISAPIPTVGASGGVFGVMLAYGMMFPNRPIYLYFLFPIKAKWLIIAMAVLELFYGFTGSQAGVANFAHLGGMGFGFLLIQYWRGKLPVKPDRTMRW